MVCNTRSSTNKDRGGDIRKDSYKGKPSCVRKSAKGTSNSQPKMRKSKPLPPLTPTLNRKSPRLEKHNSPNPVRRSDRGKKLFPSGSSISAGGPSDPIESKKIKGKKLVDVTVEKHNSPNPVRWSDAKVPGGPIESEKKCKNLADVIVESEKAESHVEEVGKKINIRDARSFLASFKRQRIKVVLDGDEGTDERDKLSDCEQLGNGEDISDCCSGRMVRELRDESIDIYIAPDEALEKSSCSLKDTHKDIQNNDTIDSSCRDNVPDESCSKCPHTSSSIRETGDGSKSFDTGKECVPLKGMFYTNGMTGDNPFGTGVSKRMSEGKVVSSDERKTLHSSLQKEMAILCQVLKFPDAVTDEALRFLEYVIRTRDINSRSQPIVQALQISLCWIAASITKTKINRKDSLVLAKHLLNYQCTEDQANEIYLILKEMYLQGPDRNMDSGRYCSLAEEGIPKEKAVAGDTDKDIKKLNKIFRKRKRILEQKHQEQLQGFQRKYEKEMAELFNDHEGKLTFIRSVHGHSSVGMDKLKVLNDDLGRKISDLNIRKDVKLKKLEAGQSADIAEEEKKKAQWMAEAKAYSIKQEQVDEGPQPSDARVGNLVTVNSLAMTESVNQSKDSSYNDEAVLVNPPAPMEVERNAAEKVSEKGCKSTPLDLAVTSGGLPSTRQPSVHFERAPDCCDLSPQRVQEKADPNSVPVELQGLDEPAAEKLSTLQTEAEAISTVIPVPSNHEAPVTDANVTPLPLINGTPVTDKTATPLLSSREATVTGKTISCLPSNRKAPATERNVQGRTFPQSVGLSVPSHNAMGFDPRVPLSHQPISGSFHPSFSADPLQNELDNLRREAEQLDNNQKDMKSRLVHDYEKEIQEVIAQIRKKYKLKFQDGVTEYQLKKKEVEKNQKTILMNQLLAAAFRYRCSDKVRQPVDSSSSLQPVHQLSTNSHFSKPFSINTYLEQRFGSGALR